MDNLVLGDGLTEGVSQGPIINKSQFDKVAFQINLALHQVYINKNL